MASAKFLITILQLALILPVASPALAQSTGAVSGRVVDEATQTPLPGAAVRIQGKALSTDTDRSGAFQLLRIPAGQKSISISYLGYETASFDIEVRAGQTVSLEAALKPIPQVKESIDVYGEPLLDGQARSLNQQKTALNIVNIVSADQIGRFPDPNAAEATQRIPGVVIQRDQSQGNNSYVVYRRENNNGYVKTFRIVAGNGIDEVSETDGIHLTAAYLGHRFPNGVFIAQDGQDDKGKQNFKLVPWHLVVKE